MVNFELRSLDDFGGTDADNDPLLVDCFEDHPAYLSLIAGKRNVILGRKGSGKTAVYLRTRQEFKNHAIGFTFADYPWAHHELQKQSGVPHEQCFVESWKYFCLIALSRVVLSRALIADAEIGDRLSVVRTFIKDTYGTDTPEPARIFSPAHQLRMSGQIGARLGPIGGGVSLDRVPMTELPKFASEVNRYIGEALMSAMKADQRYYLLFDQLDQGFSVVEPDYKLRLIGLLLACKSLNEQAKQHGVQLTASIFLRDDIYDVLQFEDKNKITQNSVALIRWDVRDGKGEPTLKSLMEKRFGRVLQEDAQWSALFDEKRQMPGRQTKYNYMRDRTFLRPRDMIKFCNETLGAYKADSGVGEFANKHIQNAQPAYSEYLLAELDDEIHKHVPDYRSYLEVIRDIGAAQFTREEFIEAWRRRATQLKLKPEPLQALSHLFDFSIIGYLAVGGATGGSGFIYRYKSDRATFNETASNFRVHWGLKEVLSLTRS